MHMQGGSRRSPVASPGEIVHEKGKPQHEARVVESGDSYVVVEYLRTGREYELGRGEYEQIFAQDYSYDDRLDEIEAEAAQ